MTLGPVNSQSSYLPTEFDIPVDTSQTNIQELIAKRERLTARIMNVKENSNYELRELISAQQWFSKKVGGAIVTQYGYRTTFDLVALNGGSIGAGATTLTLTATTMPPQIQNANGLIPTHIYGAATVAGPKYIGFPSDTIIIVLDFSTATAQKIIITNNFGSNLTQCYLVFEYLKT